MTGPPSIAPRDTVFDDIARITHAADVVAGFS